VEDSRSDRELVAEVMRREHFDCAFTYAETAEEFRKGLETVSCDLIFSDYSLPSFSGEAALAMARTARPDTPFLFVSGTIGEERAVASIKAGATDYVLKDRLERLGPAVRRVLREAQERAERLSVEQQLRLFRSLLDHATDSIEVIDPATGRFLDVNERACLVHGYTREEYLGLAVSQLDPWVAERSWEKVQEEFRDRDSILIESEHRRKDGSTFPVEVRATRVRLDRDYILAIVSDITERKKTERALQVSEERFRELAETINEVFWITDPQKSRMLYISPAYEEIWGRSCASLYREPRSWVDAIHPEDRERVLRATTNQQAGGSFDEEYRIIRPDGTERWIRDNAFPVRNAAGEIERIAGVAQDITERRQLEEQFRQSQKMEAVGQLAGGVAHDFNNLLAVMRLNVELIIASAEQLDTLTTECLNEIMAAAESAGSLIRQLLLFSRKQVVQMRDLDVNGTVTSLTRMLQRIIGADVQLSSRLHVAPLITHADPGMLDQVLVNLAVNARDAMPEGGELIIQTTEENVDGRSHRLHADAAPGRYACLKVRDTGVGIPPEILPRIFEPFFTTKEPGRGTGLGLATVFGIVKQHGGFITVESEVGKGTEFRVYLPVGKATPESVACASQARPRGGTETILLVEDENMLRSISRLTLERQGYRVLEAANGSDALRIWEEHRDAIALLVTDLVMPGGLNGQQLARRLREAEPRLKVIFTSGYRAEIAGGQAELEPGKNFLQKPFAANCLLETVRRCLDAGE
jgi:PAS domain S-box-containing protein